jgi:hypothetical protein
MDPLWPILIITVAAVLIALLTGITLAWYNRGSRNLALATAGLFGASLFFGMQLWFELRPEVRSDFIVAKLGIDRTKPEIRQWIYSSESGDRITAEVYASNWLAAHRPEAFSGNREKLTSDLVLFSLAYFLQTPGAQYWEVRRHLLGSVLRFYPTTSERRCTIVTSAEVSSRLLSSHNLFDGAELPSGPVCFPLGTVFSITANSLVIRNHVCELTFTIEPSRGVNFQSPRVGEEFSKLPNGESRFETRATGLDVEARFFALRKGQRDGDEYRQWASALIDGARDWFEK